jgi:hypothetical protein
MMLEPILKRLRRKVEIVRLDTKARNHAVYHDINEMMTLVEMVDKAVRDGDAPGLRAADEVAIKLGDALQDIRSLRVENAQLTNRLAAREELLLKHGIDW